MTQALAVVVPEPFVLSPKERKLIEMVEASVTSAHSKRSYRKALEGFFFWFHEHSGGRGFTKELAQAYRASLIAQGLAPSTVNVRLSAVRKLAREMADNKRIDLATSAAIQTMPCMKSHGTRVGNWLAKDQANELLNAPDTETLIGLRDRAILGVLLGCGLRRGELMGIQVNDLQQREGRWVMPDMLGKGNRVRTVTVPAAVKARIDTWLAAAGIANGFIFRPVNKGNRICGDRLRDDKVIWEIVERYAKQTSLGRLAPHDLRRTCAKLCRKAGGDLEQIQLLLGHASIQTTERYLGTEQALAHAVNDAIGLELL